MTEPLGFWADDTDVSLTAFALIKSIVEDDTEAMRALLPEDNFTASVMVNLAHYAAAGMTLSAREAGTDLPTFMQDLMLEIERRRGEDPPG